MLTRRDKSLTERGWVEYRSEGMVTYKHSRTKVEVTFKPDDQVMVQIGLTVTTYEVKCEGAATYLDRLSRVLSKEEQRIASRMAALALEVGELCAARQLIDPIQWDLGRVG